MTKLSSTASVLARSLPLWVALGVGAAVTAQDSRPLALRHARIVTMTDAGVIEDGTVLIEDGRITAVGKDVKIPLGAREVDLEGGTVLPGLVHAWSRAGTSETSRGGGIPDGIPERFRRQLQGGGRGGSNNPVNTAATTIADGIYARQDVFGELLEKGVTTLVIRPDGVGLPGQAAELDPSGDIGDSRTIADEVYLAILPSNDTKSAKLFEEAFEKAKQVVVERNKPKPAEPKPKDGDQPAKAPEKAAKPAEGEQPEGPPKPGDEPKPGPEPKPGDEPKPGGEAKPTGEAADAAKAKPAPKKPEPKKDPNIEVLADLLEGKRRAFLRLSSATDIQYFTSLMSKLEDVKFTKTVVADNLDAREGRLSQALDTLSAMEAIVLMEPKLESVPYTRTIVNTSKQLNDAGIRVGFLLDDSPRGVQRLWFSLMELVRCGLPSEVALAGVTRVPAEALDMADEVGSIAAGRRADLLVFDGDPLDPTSRLRSVYRAGRVVPSAAESAAKSAKATR